MENDYRNSNNINGAQETRRGMTYVYFSPNFKSLTISRRKPTSIDLIVAHALSAPHGKLTSCAGSMVV